MSSFKKTLIPIIIERYKLPFSEYRLKNPLTKKNLIAILFYSFIARGYYEMYQEIVIIRPILAILTIAFISMTIFIVIFGAVLIAIARYKQRIASHIIDIRRLFII